MPNECIVNSRAWHTEIWLEVSCHTDYDSIHAGNHVAAAASLQSCPTLCDPINGSPPGFPSLGFSRQEHWSGLPFPSPLHESEKWKWIRSVVSNPQRPHGLQPSRLLRPWDFLGKSTGVGCHCLLQGIMLDGNNFLHHTNREGSSSVKTGISSLWAVNHNVRLFHSDTWSLNNTKVAGIKILRVSPEESPGGAVIRTLSSHC